MAVTLGASSSTIAILNPQYESWLVVDQLILGWLYNSMTTEVATQVMGYENAEDLWHVIQELFRVQLRAEEDFLRQVFQQARKARRGCVKYAFYFLFIYYFCFFFFLIFE